MFPHMDGYSIRNINRDFTNQRRFYRQSTHLTHIGVSPTLMPRRDGWENHSLHEFRKSHFGTSGKSFSPKKDFCKITPKFHFLENLHQKSHFHFGCPKKLPPFFSSGFAGQTEPSFLGSIRGRRPWCKSSQLRCASTGRVHQNPLVFSWFYRDFMMIFLMKNRNGLLGYPDFPHEK